MGAPRTHIPVLPRLSGRASRPVKSSLQELPVCLPLPPLHREALLPDRGFDRFCLSFILPGADGEGGQPAVGLLPGNDHKRHFSWAPSSLPPDPRAGDSAGSSGLHSQVHGFLVLLMDGKGTAGSSDSRPGTVELRHSTCMSLHRPQGPLPTILRRGGVPPTPPTPHPSPDASGSSEHREAPAPSLHHSPPLYHLKAS